MASKAVILVGGGTRGTRFRPLSMDIPKVLFPVGGKPMLSHSIDALAKLPSLKEIILIGFYDDYVFTQFITETTKTHPHLSIRYLREYKAMGTAGGLYHFRDFICKGNPSKFFVIHADVCSSFPLPEISKFFDEKKANAVIMGTKVEPSEALNYGAVVSSPDQKVIHYVEKPETLISSLVNAGVYLFDKTVFEVLAAAKADREEAVLSDAYPEDNDDDILSLEQDLLVRLVETQGFYVYETRDFWRQIKEAGSAIPANALYLQQLFQTDPNAPGLAPASATIVPPVFIDPSAKVDPTAKLGPDVSIGANVKIGPGARVKDSIVLDNVEIRHDAAVLHSIVATGSKVGSWARIEGTATNPKEHKSIIVKDGVKVPIVSILASQVVVADEVYVKNTVVLPHKDIKTDVKNEVIM